MKLVLKIPKGKPPFIGIEYEEHFADRENYDLVKKHSNEEYRIVLEPGKNRLWLQLMCEELVTVRDYKNIDYDAKKLKDWLKITAQSKVFNFGHVFLKDNRHQIARLVPSRKAFVLKVTKIELDPFGRCTTHEDFDRGDEFHGLSIA